MHWRLHFKNVIQVWYKLSRTLRSSMKQKQMYEANATFSLMRKLFNAFFQKQIYFQQDGASAHLDSSFKDNLQESFSDYGFIEADQFLSLYGHPANFFSLWFVRHCSRKKCSRCLWTKTTDHGGYRRNNIRDTPERTNHVFLATNGAHAEFLECVK